MSNSSRTTAAAATPQQQQEEQEEPPRNFTAQQLRVFDGTPDEHNQQPKPVYLSVAGIVFDVSDGRDFYGPGGPYEKFAGRECGVALSKFAFDEIYLDVPVDRASLNPGERMELDQWIEKFQYYRHYPIKGKLVSVMPDPDRVLTLDEMASYNGTQPVPEGYATPPIYIGVGGNVFDMSFGGVSFYGPGGPYHKLAGRNASRALATMKLDDEAFVNANQLNDLTEKQIKTMNDWSKTFTERKMYPIVGKMASSS